MEDLIENAHILFDERFLSSPPLPPAPAGEAVPVISYGSSHTKMTLPECGEVQVADFTPELPARPTGSIHPSARSNPPMSPSRLSADLPVAATAPQSPPLPPLPLQVPDTTEQSTHEQVVPDTSVAEAVKRVPDSGIVPPLTVKREQHQEEQQSGTDSVPETPVTISSLASTSQSSSE
jgi:hypothetical protein